MAKIIGFTAIVRKYTVDLSSEMSQSSALEHLDDVPLHAECHGPAVPGAGVGAHLAAARRLHQRVLRGQQSSHEAVHGSSDDGIKVFHRVLSEERGRRLPTRNIHECAEDVVVCNPEFSVCRNAKC